MILIVLSILLFRKIIKEKKGLKILGFPELAYWNF